MYVPLWFEKKLDPLTGEMACVYKGGYWRPRRGRTGTCAPTSSERRPASGRTAQFSAPWPLPSHRSPSVLNNTFGVLTLEGGRADPVLCFPGAPGLPPAFTMTQPPWGPQLQLPATQAGCPGPGLPQSPAPQGGTGPSQGATSQFFRKKLSPISFSAKMFSKYF